MSQPLEPRLLSPGDRANSEEPSRRFREVHARTNHARSDGGSLVRWQRGELGAENTPRSPEERLRRLSPKPLSEKCVTSSAERRVSRLNVLEQSPTVVS
jgi:hypothetical protein